MDESRQGAMPVATQKNAGAAVGGDEEEKEENLSSFERVLKQLNEAIGPESEQ